MNKKYSKLSRAIVNRVNILIPQTKSTMKHDHLLENTINEYLKYNVDGFENFIIDYHLVNNSGNKIPIFVFHSKDKDVPYIIIVNGKTGEIHYFIKNSVNLLDIINNNENIMTFGIKTSDKLYFNKYFFHNNRFFMEEYRPGKSIETLLYNMDSIVDYREHLIDNYKMTSSSTFDYPEFCSESFLDHSVLVKELEPHKYEIIVHDYDGNSRKKSEIVIGESLYSTYYNYMIRNNHYINEKNKTKKLKK